MNPQDGPPESEGHLRARLDRVFGDVLPDTTRDERSDGGGCGGRDDELRRDVPPHHG